MSQFIPPQEMDQRYKFNSYVSHNINCDDKHLSAYLYRAEELKLQSAFMINEDLEDIYFILPFAYLSIVQTHKRHYQNLLRQC